MLAVGQHQKTKHSATAASLEATQQPSVGLGAIYLWFSVQYYRHKWYQTEQSKFSFRIERPWLL